MTAIHAVEDDTGGLMALAAPDEVPPKQPLGGADVAAALDRALLRAAVAEAAPVLDDAARTLDPSGTGLPDDDPPRTPDDDRAAGRFDHVRLDLLSE